MKRPYKKIKEVIFINNIEKKALIITCLLLIILSLFIAHDNPITDYELSIYASTPYLVWILLIICISIAISVGIIDLYADTRGQNRIWIYSIIVAMICRVSLLYIPYIRGYFNWYADSLTQRGYVWDILLYNRIGDTNFYPITHILVAETVILTNIPMDFVINHITALFSAFYVIWIYLLSRKILPVERANKLAIFSIAAVLFNQYDVYFMPNGLSLLFMPILFFILFKSKIEFRALLILLLILYPFFHILSSIVLIFIFLLSSSLTIFGKTKDSNYYVGSFLIVFIILLFWVLSFDQFNYSIHKTYYSIITGIGRNPLTDISNSLDKINIDKIELIKLVIKIMGDDLIFFGMFGYSILCLIKNRAVRTKEYVLVSLIVIFNLILYLLYLTGGITGLGTIGFDRLEAYSVMLTPLSAGLALDYYLRNKTKSRIILVISLIILASIISIFSLYPSPSVYQPSLSVTNSDVKEMEWILEHKDRSIGFTCLLTNPYIYANGLLGKGDTLKRSDLVRIPPQVPNHFNYTLYAALGKSYSGNKYLVLNTMDLLVYTTVWKNVNRFNASDFRKMEDDKSIYRIYCGLNRSVYYVNAVDNVNNTYSIRRNKP